MFGPLGPSLTSYVLKSRSLYNFVKPFANWYAQIAGYRQMGLKYDDLLVEERDDVQRALGRLTPKETCDRVYRFRVASHASVVHKDLPQNEWIKPEDDIRYLKPHVEEVHKEDLERQHWDNVQVQRRR